MCGRPLALGQNSRCARLRLPRKLPVETNENSRRLWEWELRAWPTPSFSSVRWDVPQGTTSAGCPALRKERNTSSHQGANQRLENIVLYLDSLRCSELRMVD